MLLYLLPSDTKHWMKSLATVNKNGGAVGRLIHVLGWIELLLLILSGASSDLLVSRGAFVAAVILAFVFVWRIINLIDRHPDSILEGEHFVAYAMHASKQQNSLPIIEVGPESTQNLIEGSESFHPAELPDAESVVDRLLVNEEENQ